MVDRGARLGADGRLDDEVMLAVPRVSSAGSARTSARSARPRVRRRGAARGRPRAGGRAGRRPLRQRAPTTLYQLVLGTTSGAGAVSTPPPMAGPRRRGWCELGARERAARRDGGASRLVVRRAPSGRSRATAVAERDARRSAASSRTRRSWSSELLVKTYRRVEAGLNPELEHAAASSPSTASRTCPSSSAGTATRASACSATLGMLQRFLPDAVDGWALALGGGCRDAPDAFLDRLHRLGAVVGEMHGVLASDAVGSRVRARGTAAGDARPRSPRRIDEEIDAVFDELPDRRRRSRRIAGRRDDDPRSPARCWPNRRRSVATIRTHGDLHLGQVLWQRRRLARRSTSRASRRGRSPSGGARRIAAARRRRACCARSRTSPPRSTAPGTALPRRGSEARARPVPRRRTATTARRRRCSRPPQRGAGAASCVMFELEKAFYELRYELDHRPDWVARPGAQASPRSSTAMPDAGPSRPRSNATSTGSSPAPPRPALRPRRHPRPGGGVVVRAYRPGIRGAERRRRR